MSKPQADAAQTDGQYDQVKLTEQSTGDYDDDDLGPGAMGPGTHPHAVDRSIGKHPHQDQDDRSNKDDEHPHRGLKRY